MEKTESLKRAASGSWENFKIEKDKEFVVFKENSIIPILGFYKILGEFH